MKQYQVMQARKPPIKPSIVQSIFDHVQLQQNRSYEFTSDSYKPGDQVHLYVIVPLYFNLAMNSRTMYFD